MHHPAAVEAAPRLENGRECAYTASRPYSAALVLRGHRYLEARDMHPIQYRVLFKQQHHLLHTTDDLLCTPALNSIRTAQWVTVLAALTGTSGMFVYCLLSLVAVQSTGRS